MPHPKLDLWREKIASKTISKEEYAELVRDLREGRDAAAAMLVKKPKVPKEPKPKKGKKDGATEPNP